MSFYLPRSDIISWFAGFISRTGEAREYEGVLTEHIVVSNIFMVTNYLLYRSQWPSGLRRGTAAGRLLGLRVWIPPWARMFVCCECCVFVRQRSLRRADHSSWGVLPTVLCYCVWCRNLKNEETKTRKWVVKANKTRIIIRNTVTRNGETCGRTNRHKHVAIRSPSTFPNCWSLLALLSFKGERNWVLSTEKFLLHGLYLRAVKTAIWSAADH